MENSERSSTEDVEWLHIDRPSDIQTCLDGLRKHWLELRDSLPLCPTQERRECVQKQMDAVACLGRFVKETYVQYIR